MVEQTLHRSEFTGNERPQHTSVAELYESSFVDRYDLSASVWERLFCSNALQSFHRRLSLLPTRPLRVLDLGCGTGRNLKRLAAAGVVIDSYTGVDRSSRMLARATHKHPYSRARFESGTAIDAARASSECDLVLATWIFSHQPNPAELLDAARAALAPGGHLLVLALTSTHQVVGRLHGWRFRRCLSATPIDPMLLQGAAPAHLTVSGRGLITCADIVGPPAPCDVVPRRNGRVRPSHSESSHLTEDSRRKHGQSTVSQTGVLGHHRKHRRAAVHLDAGPRRHPVTAGQHPTFGDSGGVVRR